MLQGFVWYVQINILRLSPLRVLQLDLFGQLDIFHGITRVYNKIYSSYERPCCTGTVFRAM